MAQGENPPQKEDLKASSTFCLELGSSALIENNVQK